jgi:hypothetical protein
MVINMFKKGDLEIRDSVPKDIESLSFTMRQADKEEVWAQSHSTPREALQYSYDKSEIALTVLWKGKIAGMFGIKPKSLISDRAIVWLLTSDEVSNMKLSFAKYSKKVMNMFLNLYPVLENYVDSRYIDSVKWLKWCGFKIGEAEPHGLDKVPFHRAVIRRKNQ